MSAFICSDDHIKALAIFAATRQHSSWRVDPRYIDGLPCPEACSIENLCRDELATLYAQVLLAENVRSVNHRYRESEHHSIKVSDSDCMKLQQKAVQILKMLDCLEYQSCETSNYYETVAHKLLSALRRAAIRALPGYNDAAWTFDAQVAA